MPTDGLQRGAAKGTISPYSYSAAKAVHTHLRRAIKGVGLLCCCCCGKAAILIIVGLANLHKTHVRILKIASEWSKN